MVGQADISALKRQLEQKWRALDAFEASVKKLEVTRMSWRSKYSVKDGELDGAKVGHIAAVLTSVSNRGTPISTELFESWQQRRQQLTSAFID